MNDLVRLKVFVDGGCFPNPGKAGWGWFCEKDEEVNSGSISYGTNNVAELTAAIRGIEENKHKGLLVIWSDSQYVVKGMNDWIHNWKRLGWRLGKNKPLPNVLLWQELDRLREETDAAFAWVRGHSGVRGNEVADALATNEVFGRIRTNKEVSVLQFR